MPPQDELMDYFQGVVTAFLRADRSMFVNTECCIQLNAAANPDNSGPHWYCDALAVNFREKEIFLCEITYSKSLDALAKRLSGWAEHWELLKVALVRDCALPPEWPVRPWIFTPKELVPLLERKLAKLAFADGESTNMPKPKITDLESVMPWLYRSWNRHTKNQSQSTYEIFTQLQNNSVPDHGTPMDNL
jgi:hypothetical protein